MKIVLEELEANVMMSIMLYCKNKGYTQTATCIDRDFDFHYFSEYKKLNDDQNENTASKVTFDQMNGKSCNLL